MMDTAKKELSQILLLLAVILGGVVVFQWLLVNDLCSPSSYVLLRLEKILRKAMMIRFIYVLVITGLAFLYPSRNIKKDESLKGAYTALTLLLATVLVLGFSRAFAWYNLIIFPIVFILFTVVVVKTAGFYMKWHVLSDKSIFGLSLKKSKFFLEFETADGPIRIHRPQQNIYINGGPGSGKSESWIKGIIYQCAELRSQEKFNSAYVVNASIGKNWFIKRQYTLGFSLEMKNLLNDQDIKTGGYEQVRLLKNKDTSYQTYQPFDSKYFYMFGSTYYLNLYFRF